MGILNTIRNKIVKSILFNSNIQQGNINTVYSNEQYGIPIKPEDKQRRGIQVYSISRLIGITGRDEQGRLLNWGTEMPYFYLTVNQRIQIAKLSTPIFGVVTSRMNRIAGIDFNIMPVKESEDRVADEMKGYYQIYKEIQKINDVKHIMIRAKIVSELKYHLKDLLPDISNFQTALIRWKKNIRNKQSQKGEEIKEWILEPNTGVSWQDYIRKLIFDLLIHGNVATYKQKNNEGRLQNFDILPGGTVYKIKQPYFSATEAYVQVIPGYEPQIFFANEISYLEYLPISGYAYGMIPLECLINKVSESMFFDRLMAEQADGTKPPEKMAIVTNPNPFGDFDKDENIPLDLDEQRRIEKKVNEPVKGAIMTFSGNDVKIVDLSRENTMAIQNERQKDIREEVALVFNMSNVEINLTGSADTSGRATSETQQEIEQGKGITPILRLIETKITKDIINARYGYGYKIEFHKTKDDMKERQLDQLKLNNGEITVNELREDKNLPPFDDIQFDKPRGMQPAGTELGSELSPMFVRQK